MKKFVVIKAAFRLLSAKTPVVLLFSLPLVCAANGGEPPITFDNNPLLGIPLDAQKQEVKELRASDGSLTFKTITEGTIETLRIRFFEKETWDSEAQVSEYLAGFLNYEGTNIHNFQVWSQGVGAPEIECVIDFTDDHIEKLREDRGSGELVQLEGRLLLWKTVGCYRDANGRWFFLTLGEYFHGAHPDGTRELAGPSVKEAVKDSSSDQKTTAAEEETKD